MVSELMKVLKEYKKAFGDQTVYLLQHSDGVAEAFYTAAIIDPKLNGIMLLDHKASLTYDLVKAEKDLQ